ncbi:ImmA/IrrE family metallo-endopeptidase [Candidatus Pacearchaeota archaeon]|nr:ImmA/IrrE family metallo-endopeptidase [Candidatus Pacearchaeota archaeon]
MNISTIEKGYRIFKENNGKITRWFNESYIRGSLAYIESRPLIMINKNDSIDEQLKTLIHELLHIGYEHDLLIKKPRQECAQDLEEKINQETEEIFESCPDMIEILKKEIGTSFIVPD